MIDNSKTHLDLASFARTQEKMIKESQSAGFSTYNYYTNYKLRDYTSEEIQRIITSGDIVKQRELSRVYFYKDGFYKRILLYYATILKYVGILIPNPAFGQSLSNSAIAKRYYNAMNFIEAVKIPQILTHCSIQVLINGSYFGVIKELDKSKLILLDLPSKFCRSRFQDLEGNDLIEFDVSYFNTILDADIKKEMLNLYPKEIKHFYRRWMAGKEDTSWLVISPAIGICFTITDGRPLFLNVIPATLQYEEAVETERERDLEEIRKIIVQKIPHMADGGLLFEPEEAAVIHKGTVGMMKQNKNVSILTTYADVDAIVSKTTSDAVSNNLEKMVNNIYYESGTTSQLFAATGNLALSTSLKNDLAFMMILGNKYSSFLTAIVNRVFSNSAINFKYDILPISYYNDSDYIKDTFKLAQSGYSFILPALACGLSQRDINNVKDLENQLLKLGDKFQPLGSAYTQSKSDNNVGRPPLSDEDKSPKTIANEESLDNQGGSE